MREKGRKGGEREGRDERGKRGRERKLRDRQADRQISTSISRGDAS